jgi:hypothetical protein
VEQITPEERARGQAAGIGTFGGIFGPYLTREQIKEANFKTVERAELTLDAILGVSRLPTVLGSKWRNDSADHDF